MKKVKDKDGTLQFLKVIKKVVPYIFKGSPLMFIYMRVMAIIYSLLWVSIVPANKVMFDTIMDGIQGKASYRKIIITILIVFLILIVQHFFNGLNAYNHMMNYFKIDGYLNYNINEKAKLINPIDFEDPACLDNINKARKGADSASYLVDVLFSILTFYGPYLTFYGFYFYSLKPVLLLSLFLVFIPMLITQFIRTSIYIKLEDEVAPLRREFEHYEKCICSREYFKETRILGAFNFFKELYESTLRLLNKKQWKADRKTGVFELGMKLITLSGYFGVLYLLFMSVINKDITVGAFASVFISLDTLFGVVKELISKEIGTVTQNLGTVKNFIDFIDMPERKGKSVKVDFNSGIEVLDASFKYPGKEELALENINLKINNGETLAIVGENGAGKTTLVRMLMGLYTPTEGTVKIGGEDTRALSASAIYEGISAVSQGYQKYKLSLSDNITISDFNSSGDVESSIQKAGLSLDNEKFPQGLDTMLSCEFKGVDLSGGQWQRIAIARGFYRKHDLIILDEPTAAIDPLEETRVYKMFAEISKGKTAIIVTHRIGSAKIADRILVMDKGRAIESGTHEELMKEKGKYSIMFEEQAKWYER